MWTMTRDRVELDTPVDRRLEMAFFRFSMTVYPKNYGNKTTPCTWYLDRDKKLANAAGRNEETKIWFRHLHKFFFHPRAIDVGSFSIMNESRPSFWQTADERIEEYVSWIDRMCEMCDDPKLIRMARTKKWSLLQEYYAESLSRKHKRGGKVQA